MLIILNYVKFVSFYNYDDAVEVIDTNVSSTEAVENALTEIINNFNSDEEISQYKNQGIDINAKLNNYSLYIEYTDDTTTTYEFNYNNLMLSINIKNEENNLKKFNSIYKILIKAIQKRIKNEDELDLLINSHINEEIELIGIDKIINNNKTIFYKIDITKKIKAKEGE